MEMLNVDSWDIFSQGTLLYTHPCVSVCVSIPRFQNSQPNLYWGQAGARF